MQNFMSYHVYMLKSECEFNVMLGYDVMLILCVTVCVIGSCWIVNWELCTQRAWIAEFFKVNELSMRNRVGLILV
jgi:hypothetical protein